MIYMSLKARNFKILITILTLCVAANAMAKDGSTMVRCDIKKLQLTETQKNKLRQLRPAGKQAREESRREWLTYRKQTEHLMLQKDFDEKKAQTIINNYMEKDAHRQLDYLKLKHTFFSILNENQKIIWLRECSQETLPSF